MKKKAIKIAAASAVAASAFVAAVPHQADAASNVQTEVSKAVTKMQKAYHTYSDVTATGKFADLTAVYADYNAAKAAYNNAKALVVKAGGSMKDAYLAQLDVNYNEFIAKRVVTYIDAYKYATTLAAKKDALNAALTAKNWDDAVKAYHAISYELKTRTVILDRVYGKTTRDLLRSEFKASAQTLRDSLVDEVTVYMYEKVAADKITAKDVEGAQAAIAVVDKNLLTIDKDSEFGKALVAKAAEVKTAFEALVPGKVSSVSAPNGKELVVTFNKPVDKTDAQDLANYSLVGVTFTGTPVVSEDQKTVTLTANGVIDVTNAELKIEPVQTKADTTKLTEKYVSLFTYSDKTAPSVTAIDAKGTEAVVTFNEAVASEGTVSLDGVAISNVASATSPYYVVNGKTLTVKNLVAEKSYKLDIVGARDAAANVANSMTLNFTVAKPVVDSSKPTVSTTVSGNKLTLSFSEAVTPGTVKIGGTAVAGSKVVASEDKKTYTVDVQDAGFFAGTTFFTKEVEISGFADSASTPNVMDTVKVTSTFTADTTAPNFVSATVKTMGKDTPTATKDYILLTFDDAVHAGDLSGAGELVIKTIDGIYQSNNVVDLASADVLYGYDLDGKDGVKGNEANVVAISIDLKEKSSYSFELAGKTVADFYGNQVKNTLSFSAVAPEFVPATSTTDTKDVTFTATPQAGNLDLNLMFNKPMSDTAVNLANYKLDGKALPTGTQIKFVDNRSKVVVTLPQGSVTANGTRILEATGLTDTNGNTLANGKVVNYVNLTENVLPVASKVSVTDSKTINVDFSETITAPAAVTGVTVKVNNVTLAADKFTAVVENGKLKVTTVDNLAATDAITVEFKDTNLQDVNNNKVANSTVSK